MENLATVIEFPQEQEEKQDRRERGTGRLIEPHSATNKSSLWWVQFYARGRQVRKSSKSTVKEVAKRFLAEEIAKAAAGISAPPNVDRLKYDDLRAALIAEYIVKERKWLRTGKDGKRYISHLTALNEAFNGYRVRAINPDRIRAFVRAQQEKGLSNATVNRALALLRRMFRLAVREKKLRVDDVPYFQMLKESKPRQGFLEYNGFLKLRAELPEPIRAIAAAGFYTGMRVSEILSLRWTDVNLTEGHVFLGETKNGESRVVPLAHELLELLKAERQSNPTGEFVFTRNGKPVRDFRQVWRNACVKAGLARFVQGRYEGLIFHDLRRSAVRAFDRAGVSRSVAMCISGHKTESVYRRYNIVSAKDLQLATAKLESYFGATSGRSEETGGEASASVNSK